MPEKRPLRNRLNDLPARQWLKFQKSWFVHNPPRRKKDVLRHPAKFPETLAQEFIAFFTKAGARVLDPMVGTGSTVVACLRAGRNSIGIELNPEYAELARALSWHSSGRPSGRGGRASGGRDPHRRCGAPRQLRAADLRLRADLAALLGYAARPRRRDPAPAAVLAGARRHLLRRSGRPGQRRRL